MAGAGEQDFRSNKFDGLLCLRMRRGRPWKLACPSKRPSLNDYPLRWPVFVPLSGRGWLGAQSAVNCNWSTGMRIGVKFTGPSTLWGGTSEALRLQKEVCTVGGTY